MKNLIWIVLLTGYMWTDAPAAEGDTVMASYMEKEWNSMCRTAQKFDLSCDGVEMPPVATIPIPDYNGHVVAGYHKGGVVWLNDKIPASKRRTVVIIHEMTHYLLRELGMVPEELTEETACITEAYAFKVQNRYARLNRLDSLTQYDWWKLYPYCSRGDVHIPTSK